ncbi:MAG TPA: hypothetical protein VHB79_19625 [Polyangiaceae bacterium]|nr:hypothetical protein [Polyangiaceae bacterium]
MSNPQLRTDERGAIMVLALFFAIFGLAILYTLLGTAQAIFLREKLQDAADSAALSTAIMHARGMNLLVLINIVMAALLAILVILKSVESIAILGIILAAALAYWTGGATLSAIAPLKNLQQVMHNEYESLHDPVYAALETLHSAADAVAEVAPGVGLAAVEADIMTHAAPAKGVVIPPRITLPVEDDSFDNLCKKAATLPGEVAQQALEDAGIPTVPKLPEALGAGVGALAKTFSEWFCGDSGSSDEPKMSQTIEQSYPKVVTTDTETCNHVDQDGEDGPSKEEVSDACDRSKADEEAGKPDDDSGACRKDVDCSIEGPYEKRIKLAREQCDPMEPTRPFAYWYQQRTGHVDYEWTEKGWKRHEPVMNPPSRVGGKDGVPQAPCGPRGVGQVAVGYNKIVHPHDDVEETLPVCTTEKKPFLPPEHNTFGTIDSQEITEVTQILGCRKYEKKDIPVTAGEQAGQQEDSKSPKKIEKDVALGDKNFQLRAVMWAQPSDSFGKIVDLALWNKKKPDDPLSLLQPMRGFAVAQAEYFYDDTNNEWLWDMKWRARLRRFRFEDQELQSVKKMCDAVDEAVGDKVNCEANLTAIMNIANLINH